MTQATPISAEAVRAELEKILSSAPFANAERSRAMLKFVVENSLNQQAERLKEYTLGTEVFGRGASFDPRIDPIVRAEASRLRSRLDYFYAGAGRTDAVEISLPKGTYAPKFSWREIESEAPIPALSAAANVPPVQEPSRSRVPQSLWIAVAVAACLVSFVIGWRIRKEPASSAQWKVRRLTSDAGFASSPAMSADGKLVAYSSDQGTQGAMDLYVKQVSGGQPIRLTTDGANNTSPDFSPDGTKIVFRSERDGGGIDEIAAFGGEVRRLAPDGRNPKFSPDGTEIAYWVGGDTVAATVPGQGEVWIVSAAGGPPRRIGAQFTNARFPIWSPDGRHLLIVGYTSTLPSVNSAIDWWVIATEGDSAVRAGLFDTLPHAGLKVTDTPATPFATFPNVPPPGCWLAGGDRIIFSTRTGETQNLWETGISRQTGRVDGVFKRLTASAGNEIEPSCASNDTLAFTNYEPIYQVWSIPYDLNAARPKGIFEQMVSTSTAREPSLSGDGRFVAYTSSQAGPLNIWQRDLQAARESHIANSATAQRFPLTNESGSRIAYSTFKEGARSVFVWSRDAAPTKLCDNCLRATAWSRDEKTLLIIGNGGGGPFTLDLVDFESRQRTPLLHHAKYGLLHGRFSPDGHWLSFTARTSADHALIMIAPFAGKGPIPENSWMRISEDRPEDRANWSPDGNTLYYTSQRDGHICLWGQRLDAVTRHPSGPAFAVQHFHGRLSYQQGGWSADGGRIAVGLSGGTGNIWIMSRDAAR